MGARHEPARCHRTADKNGDLGPLLHRLGVLDHHHRIRTAWQHAAGGNRGGSAGVQREAGGDAGGEHLAVQQQACGGLRRCAFEVGGTDGEPVHTRTVEPRHIHIGNHIGGQDAGAGLCER